MVRKIPLIKNKSPDYISKRIAQAEMEYNNWDILKQTSKGKGQFAHILSHSDGVAYFQYAGAYSKSKTRKRAELLNKKLHLAKGRAEKRKITAELDLINTELMREKYHTLDKETQKIILKMDKKVGTLGDIREDNIIKGKIVDLSFGDLGKPRNSKDRLKGIKAKRDAFFAYGLSKYKNRKKES